MYQFILFEKQKGQKRDAFDLHFLIFLLFSNIHQKLLLSFQQSCLHCGLQYCGVL